MYNTSLFTFLTGSIGILILIVYILINTIMTGWLASQKGYSIGSWVALSLFFGPLALLTLGFAPNLKTEETLNSIKRSLTSQNKTLTSNSEIRGKANPIIKNNKISCDASNNEDVQLNFSSLMDRTQYDDLSLENKRLYRSKIEEKIKLEINETKKLTYYRNLSYLGYPYYDRYLPK